MSPGRTDARPPYVSDGDGVDGAADAGPVASKGSRRGRAAHAALRKLSIACACLSFNVCLSTPCQAASPVGMLILFVANTCAIYVISTVRHRSPFGSLQDGKTPWCVPATDGFRSSRSDWARACSVPPRPPRPRPPVPRPPRSLRTGRTGRVSSARSSTGRRTACRTRYPPTGPRPRPPRGTASAHSRPPATAHRRPAHPRPSTSRATRWSAPSSSTANRSAATPTAPAASCTRPPRTSC
ncbi:protein of unknown function [Streptomyces murinus]